MNQKSNYHHGDLRKKLIDESLDILKTEGLEHLSMRKLAERASVSRTAPYHHFKDKNELLASIAQAGFVQLSEMILNLSDNNLSDGPSVDKQFSEDKGIASKDHFSHVLNTYLEFALENAVQYDLMFGQQLWRKEPSDQLQRTAKDCFRIYAKVIHDLQEAGNLIKDDDSLRMAQVLWSTMHGLIKLAHDGIVLREEDLKEIAQYAMSKYQIN